jgi:CheY-like chemotaxis protein
MIAEKSIFLVDDDPTFIFLTKKLILNTKIAAKINEFSDGQQALDFLTDNLEAQDQYPDLIFLDLSMPIVDGWDFLNEYLLIEKLINKKIKLFIVSSSISPHDIERAKNYKIVADFIIKPILKEKFLEIIENLCQDDSTSGMA